MLVNRVKFMLVTFVLMIGLTALFKNPFIGGALTFIIVLTGYFFIGSMRSKIRMDLLEMHCDPQAFLEVTEEQRKITGRDGRLNAYLNIDRAAGLSALGDFQGAKELLLSIEQDKLSVKNGTRLIHTFNLISCLYELGELEEAEKLFETQVPALPPVSPRMTLLMELLVAERLFFLNRLEESREKFEALFQQKVSKRIELHLEYRLAQIAEKNGEPEQTKEKYGKVKEQGNQLWIAKQAEERLLQL